MKKDNLFEWWTEEELPEGYKWHELPPPPPRPKRSDVRMVIKLPMSNICVDNYGELWHFYVSGDKLEWFPTGIMTCKEKP